jgi:hypothetical protein
MNGYELRFPLEDMFIFGRAVRGDTASIRMMAINGSTCLARLARGWSRKAVILKSDTVALLVINLTKWWSSGLATIGRSRDLSIVGKIRLLNNSTWRTRLHVGHFCPHLILELLFEPPLSKYSLVEMQPVLLRPHDHTRPHEPHIRDYLICREAVTIDQVRPDKASSPSKPGFAMHCDPSLLDSNHLVRESDEFPNNIESWTCTVVEDHVKVLYSKGREKWGRVEFRIKPDYQTNISLREML